MRSAPAILGVLLQTIAALSQIHAAQPAPPPDGLLEKARRAALNYAASLPDFLCTEVIHRYEDPRGANRWSNLDVLTVRLSYYQHAEDYKLTAIDGNPTTLDYMKTGGPTTKGEFGALLYLLFHPQSGAMFHWKGWTNYHKRRAAVFTYKIDQAHSSYRVSFGTTVDGPNSILAPYHGEVYVEPETGGILHATQLAELPLNFPIRQSDTTVDYAYAAVGGRQYLLPARAEITLASGRYKGRNEVQFQKYQRFNTESTIDFGK